MNVKSNIFYKASTHLQLHVVHTFCALWFVIMQEIFDIWFSLVQTIHPATEWQMPKKMKQTHDVISSIFGVFASFFAFGICGANSRQKFHVIISVFTTHEQLESSNYRLLTNNTAMETWRKFIRYILKCDAA